MSGLTMTVEYPTRLCVVRGKVGYFHTWEHYSKPLPNSSATIYSQVYGIVEFDDCVRRVDPTEIVFRDEENDSLRMINADEDGKKRIIEGRKI